MATYFIMKNIDTISLFKVIPAPHLTLAALLWFCFSIYVGEPEATIGLQRVSSYLPGATLKVTLTRHMAIV